MLRENLEIANGLAGFIKETLDDDGRDFNTATIGYNGDDNDRFIEFNVKVYLG